MKQDSKFDKYITDAFRAEPDFSLSKDFAERLAEKVGRKYSFRDSLKEYSAFAAVLLGIAVIGGALFFYLNKEEMGQMYRFLFNNGTEIIGIAFILNFILFADKVLLRLLFILKKRE